MNPNAFDLQNPQDARRQSIPTSLSSLNICTISTKIMNSSVSLSSCLSLSLCVCSCVCVCHSLTHIHTNKRGFITTGFNSMRDSKFVLIIFLFFLWWQGSILHVTTGTLAGMLDKEVILTIEIHTRNRLRNLLVLKLMSLHWKYYNVIPLCTLHTHQ